MIIGQIGWAGNQNWGDDRMAYCLKRYFAKDQLIHFNGWLDAIEHPEKIQRCDYILIGGGGLIFRGFNRYVSLLESIKKPFGCIGISIEADKLHPDMEEGLNCLKQHAEFIYVRDKKSRAILQHHSKVIVGPDISFLYPYPYQKKLGKYCGFNIRNWPWWDAELFGKVDEHFRKVDQKFPHIKSLYPFKKWDAKQCFSLLSRQFPRLKPLPFYSGSYDETDYTILRSFFSSVPKRYSISLYQDFQLMVGMRLHSLIFATQLGIPFISLSYEPKNENYCDDLGLPELSLPLKEYKKLPHSITYLRQHHAEIREKLLTYTRHAEKETHHIFSCINALIHKKK